MSTPGETLIRQLQDGEKQKKVIQTYREREIDTKKKKRTVKITTPGYLDKKRKE